MTAGSLTAAAPVRAGWLVDRRQDLLSTMGGLGASLALLGLHLWGGVSSLVLWWAWVLTLDGPHLFATVSRTYLDRRERQTRRRPPFELFLAAANLWACEGAQWSP